MNFEFLVLNLKLKQFFVDILYVLYPDNLCSSVSHTFVGFDVIFRTQIAQVFRIIFLCVLGVSSVAGGEIIQLTRKLYPVNPTEIIKKQFYQIA